MPQRGISSQYQLPNFIAQVLLDHTNALHNAMGLDFGDLDLTDHNKALHDALALEHGDLSNITTCNVRAYLSAQQNIVDVTTTKILYNAEDWDVGGDFDADGADSDFTAPATDFYNVYAQTEFATMGVNPSATMYIYKEGAVEIQEEAHSFKTPGIGTVSVHGTIQLDLGEVCDIRIWQDSGSGEYIVGDRLRSFVCIAKVRG